MGAPSERTARPFFMDLQGKICKSEKNNETPHIGAFGRNLRHDIQGSMVGTTELESVTSCMSSKRSNQLSYAPVTRT